MTTQEIQRQIKIEKAIVAEMIRRRAQGVSGSDCKVEYKTNAKVCIDISGGDLDCNENYDGKYYNDCDMSLNYDIETDYKGGAYLDVDIMASTTTTTTTTTTNTVTFTLAATRLVAAF